MLFMQSRKLIYAVKYKAAHLCSDQPKKTEGKTNISFTRSCFLVNGMLACLFIVKSLKSLHSVFLRFYR